MVSPGKAPAPPRLRTIEGPDPLVVRELAEVVRQTVSFGQLVADREGDRLRQHPEAMREHFEATRFLFQKWNLELLYLLALFPRSRFGELLGRLRGISSRTLSLKLVGLETASFVTREVVEGRPPRVEYSVTPWGRVAARLTIPLMMYLSAQAPNVRPPATPPKAAP